MDNPFRPELWRPVEGFEFTDITYHRAIGVPAVRIAFDRPEVRNAFRPHTVDELSTALEHARQASDVGCVLLTGNGPSPKDGGWAFWVVPATSTPRATPPPTWTPRSSAGCTSSRCNGRSGSCRNR